MYASALKIIYHAFFHLAMSYGIIFWGNSSHSSAILSMKKKKKKKKKRIINGYGNRVSYRNLRKKFKILPSTSQQQLPLLMFVVQNKIFSLQTLEITM